MDDLKLLYAALPAYNTAAGYYYNTVEEQFASSKLAALLSATSNRFRLNYAATAVDVLVERTVISGTTAASEPAQSTLNLFWETNQLDIVSKDVHTNTYMFGDGYLIVWPDDDGKLNAYNHDPRSVRVFYDVENPRKKTHAIHTWLGSDLHLYLTRYDPDTATTFRSTAPADGLDPEVAEFTFVSSDENPVKGSLPVFHFHNHSPYGRPEHADAYGPQDMINKLTVTMMAAIDHAGFPQRYVLTDSGLNAGVASDFSDAPAATPNFDSGPGTTWLLSGSSIKVGQFEVAQSDNFLKPIESLVKQMAVTTDTPMHYLDLSGEPPSGAALRAADFPLNKKAADRQARLGSTWREVHDYALAFYGIPDTETAVLWAPPGIVDDKEFWETQALKLSMGIPLDELLREGGYTDAMIKHFLLQSASVPGETPQEGTDNGSDRSAGSERVLGDTNPSASNGSEPKPVFGSRA